jgi:hypothetical protein
MFPNTKIIKAGSFFEVAITTDRSGRTSVVVSEVTGHNYRGSVSTTIVDVELPCKTGEFKDAFPPNSQSKTGNTNRSDING